jgi:hypothetical protein
MRNVALYALLLAIPALGYPSSLSSSPAQTPVPYLTDGGAGPCSAEFTVTGPDGRPMFAALINVHIAYGFGGFHKLDMGVYTDQQGKGKFVGIPAKVKNAPLEFRATKNDLSGVAMVDPASECQARHDIILAKAKTQQ